MRKIIFTIFMWFAFAATAHSKAIKVALLNPGGQHWFWQYTVNFMQAAADDLDIELEIISSNRDHFLTVSQVAELVARKDPPDYIITGNEKSNADQIIDIANHAGVKVFLFNNGFVSAKDINKMSQPREKYSYWIGQLLPDNFVAGYKMGKILISQAIAKGLITSDQKANMIAIAGTYATHASTERIRGLKKAVAEHANQINLLQVLPSDWSYEKAEKLGSAVLSRYRDVQIIWGANDSIALGAMDAAVSLGKKPGKDILFGGCGWHDDAIKKVQQGTLATTVGGHFMDGGWALVMLYDYHHGKDFDTEPVRSEMFAIEQGNVAALLKVFVAQEWHKIDFKNFSKVYNPSIVHYDFSVEAVLKYF